MQASKLLKLGQQALLPYEKLFFDPQQPMMQAPKLLKTGEQPLLPSKKLFLNPQQPMMQASKLLKPGQQRLLGLFWKAENGRKRLLLVQNQIFRTDLPSSGVFKGMADDAPAPCGMSQRDDGN